MLGSLIGDIVGSIYEWNNIKTKDFPLFSDDCFFTDDTVMTVATADALMHGGMPDDFIDAYKKWGALYPYAGYGGRFKYWLCSDDRKPYGSYGNGSAMRVAPCAQLAYRSFSYPEATLRNARDFASDDALAQEILDRQNAEVVLSNARDFARASASVTHNHPSGIIGAEAVAYAMSMCFTYPVDVAKEHIRTKIPVLFGYNLSRTLDEIRPTYQFNESCSGTVPQAIIAFIESTNFEDAIRNAISLGGDSDTLAAITGSIAEAAYGIPEQIEQITQKYLDKRICEALECWKNFLACPKQDS